MNEITLFHTPRTRSSGVLRLLEELEAPYDLHVLPPGAQREPAFLVVNPMGKVPAITDNGAVVTETVAIYIYLADRFPGAGLAPPVGDPMRGPYLRWIAFYGSSFEPAMMDRALQREGGPRQSSPYGSYDDVLHTLTDQLARGPYLLGERYSAADVLWAGSLGYLTAFKLVPEMPVIMEYMARVNARPGIQRAAARDEALAAA